MLFRSPGQAAHGQCVIKMTEHHLALQLEVGVQVRFHGDLRGVGREGHPLGGVVGTAGQMQDTVTVCVCVWDRDCVSVEVRECVCWCVCVCFLLFDVAADEPLQLRCGLSPSDAHHGLAERRSVM